MVRVRLRDDLPLPLDAPPFNTVRAGLDTDPPTEMFEVLPTLTVRQRERIGYDDDGDPLFRWTTLVVGTAVLWEQRAETDDVAGVTSVKARAVILYDGDRAVVESAVVSSSTGGRFQVTSVEQTPGVLKFELVAK